MQKTVMILAAALGIAPVAGQASDLDTALEGALRGAAEATLKQERTREHRGERHSGDDYPKTKKAHPVGHPDYHCPPGQAKKGRC